ncbi:MAG: hypothetical protein ACFFAN_12430, partial [Promethearchaeota archaeon]
GEWFFVNIHNERKRSYWNNKSQTISCRVRFTKNHNATRFRRNIIDFLYNYNLEDLKLIVIKVNEEDYNIFQKVLGFDKFQGRDLSNEEKRRQFALAMKARDLNTDEVFGFLNLNKVVSTRIKGYYKELFYLKCYTNYFHPGHLLRCLYRWENNDHTEIEEITSIMDIEEIREEIRDIVFNYLELPKNNGS